MADINELFREITFELSKTPYSWQKNAFKHALNGRDVVVSAGTGSGKSLIFQGLCFALPQGVVLVICPLKAIIMQQVKACGRSR
jgi:ATP-dependent helicase YprA (DUF1998 family)